MNTASQDLPHHLGVLQGKLQHPTDYEQALYYFLDEFAGDALFMDQSAAEEAPHLVAVLEHVAGKALGKPASLEGIRILRLEQFGFTHGNAAVAERVVLFFFFENANTGLMALIPGMRGGTEVARFRLPPGLTGNPKRN
jgi:hypothetical protein